MRSARTQAAETRPTAPEDCKDRVTALPKSRDTAAIVSALADLIVADILRHPKIG